MKHKITILICMMLVGTATLAIAQSNIYKLHSLFLYNFTKHIQWQNVGDEFVIGVFGSDNALEVIRDSFVNKKYGGKNIRVIPIVGQGDVKTSHLVYAPKSNRAKIIDMISATDLSNKLIVTEDNLIDQGAAIGFTIRDTRLNFLISKSRIEKSGLKVSSSLLSLGEQVE
jgi:hypothetical protein